MPNGKSGTITTGQLATSGTATQLVANQPSRIQLIITNNNTTATFFVGSSASVTATNGHVVLSSGTLVLDSYTGPIFVISAGTPTATYISY
jgi:hypothetical protein